MSQTFAKSGQIVDRKVRQERILVPIGGHPDELDSLYTLNGVAAVIWDAAIAGRNLSEIVEQVQQAFDIDAETATADTRVLLQELIDIGALLPQPENP